VALRKLNENLIDIQQKNQKTEAFGRVWLDFYETTPTVTATDPPSSTKPDMDQT